MFDVPDPSDDKKMEFREKTSLVVQKNVFRAFGSYCGERLDPDGFRGFQGIQGHPGRNTDTSGEQHLKLILWTLSGHVDDLGLFFGIRPSNFDLQFHPKAYLPYEIAGKKIVFSGGIAWMKDRADDKKKLWEAMKMMFDLPSKGQ